MQAKFLNFSFLDHPDYPKRFAKSKLFDHDIVIDTWSGLVNATKFCSTVSNSKREFRSYIQTQKNRDIVISLYEKIRPTQEGWQKIYNFRNNLYIIEGNQKMIKEIGGTYVQYYSIIDVGIWCDKQIYDILCDLVLLIHERMNSERETQATKVINQITRDTRLSVNYLFKSLGKANLFDIFKSVFPWNEFHKINDFSFKCGNILIKVDPPENSQTDEQNVIFTIVISSSASSKYNVDKEEFIINYNDLPQYLTLLDTLFNNFKKKDKKDNSISNNKKTAEDIKQKIDVLVNNTPVSNSNMIEECQLIKDNSPFTINTDQTCDSINSHRNKKKYSEYYDKGELNKIPQKLIILDHKGI